MKKLLLIILMIPVLAIGSVLYATKDRIDYEVVIPVVFMILRHHITGYEPTCLEFPKSFWKSLPSCREQDVDGKAPAGENADKA